MQRALSLLVAAAVPALLLSLLAAARVEARFFDPDVAVGFDAELPVTETAAGAVAGVLVAGAVGAASRRESRRRWARRFARGALVVSLLTAVTAGVLLQVGAARLAKLRAWNGDGSVTTAGAEIARALLGGGAAFAGALALAAAALFVFGRRPSSAVRS